MLYTALLYTPDKEHTRYLVHFELAELATQVRDQAAALGIARVEDLIAITDGGNGLEEALARNLADNLTTILDWYHAAEHLCDFAKVWHGDDEAARHAWQDQAKSILYEQGGSALLSHLRALSLPAGSAKATQEELRKLIGYFEKQRAPHRLSQLLRQRLGHWQRSHGSGLQDHSSLAHASRARACAGSKTAPPQWRPCAPST